MGTKKKLQKIYTYHKTSKKLFGEGGLKQALGAQIIQDHGKIIIFLNSYMAFKYEPAIQRHKRGNVACTLNWGVRSTEDGLQLLHYLLQFRSCKIYCTKILLMIYIATVTRLLPLVKHLDFFWIYCCHIFGAFNCH